MKKLLVWSFLFLLGQGLFAMKLGQTLAVDPTDLKKAPMVKSPGVLLAYLAEEIKLGRFILTKTQNDKLSDVEHRRYQQVYEGLQVWGGEIIQHVKNGAVQSYDGEYFIISGLDTRPKLTSAQALEALKTYYEVKELIEDKDGSELVVFPIGDTDFRLAHKMIVRKADEPLFNETTFVDAETGEVLLHFPNIIQEQLTIGVGVGKREDRMKFPTTLNNNLYYMYDTSKARPFTQRTFDSQHSLPRTVYVSSTTSNSWPSDSIVNIHAYIGYAYDFYYTLFGVNGLDNNNRTVNAFAHVFDINQELYDNAFWQSDSSGMYGQGFYFLDPYQSTKDRGAAIDSVCHEYSHAITTFHSNLTYFGESGALNESFSDVFGTAIEFMFQPEGQGYNKADWIFGEDANSFFTYDKCRSQSDPNSNSQLRDAGFPSSLWYPDPCHISQKLRLYDSHGKPIDNDGVHLNCTIYPHAYYLLAHGGTNRVSGLSVTGIGIDKATKIFYDAWINRMTKTTNFLGAANALLASAFNLYGASSSEYAQMKNTIRAIGYIVN